MATVLFSKEGVYRVFIREVPNGIDDGSHYKSDIKGRVFNSEKGAIRNARKWLKKKRDRYYKKNPKLKPRVKTYRLRPKIKKKSTINKLYKMEKDVANILFRMSDKKLKIHLEYSRKKFDNKKTVAVSGETTNFNMAILTTMKDGTKNERKAVAKMLKKFTHEPYRKTNMFY